MTRSINWLRGLGGVAAAAAILASPLAVHADGDPGRGAYLARIMDCGGCHTPGALIGQPDASAELSGGDVGFAIPNLGVFYPPNLTSDPATGLGEWSAEEIARAVREGIRPDGRQLAGAMPWRAYSGLSDADAADLAAYLKSLPARTNKVPGPFGLSETIDAPYLSVVMPATR